MERRNGETSWRDKMERQNGETKWRDVHPMDIRVPPRSRIYPRENESWRIKGRERNELAFALFIYIMIS